MGQGGSQAQASVNETELRLLPGSVSRIYTSALRKELANIIIKKLEAHGQVKEWYG